jgi:formylmethanofuran dehydrogenase subunit D
MLGMLGGKINHSIRAVLTSHTGASVGSVDFGGVCIHNRFMAETFVLIPGRTSRQGTSLNEGKFTAEYMEETGTLQINAADMRRLGIADGDRVRLRSDHGQVDVPCRAAKGDELPPGLLFIAYGDASSRLMGGDTHGTGMPDSKGIDVELKKL